MVLKLDIKKAFDSISWPLLLKILRHRGFPERFCSWIDDLLSTARTAVLLNRVPGNWIQCRNDLRQGDPIFPYLFIIVADIFQQLILSAASDHANDLRHPVYEDLPPTILQYADDTLILDDFGLATGLCINFSKTTFVPLHVDSPCAAAISHVFGCAISGFPQPYLGLPLSPYKLPPSVFQPLVTSYRSLLPGWCAKLLNRAARLVLISFVLDSLATYFLSVFKLPKKTLKILDAIRRAFFWAAEETCTGSKCLIAWENVCKPKKFGGLGIKNLAAQNN